MTDKVQKIRKEVERMHKLLPSVIDSDNIYLDYADRICTTLEMFIDSLQEEPVSDTQSSVIFYGLTGSVGNTKDEPVSDDLEYASEKYACRFTSSKYGHDKIKATFKAGANWQKEQMMKDAIGREVAEGSMCPAIETLPVLTHTDMILLPKDKFKSGDKVKIIIIRED